MKEYIERAAILKSLGYDEKRRADVLPGSTFDIVLKEAAADVAEVRHGRWVFDHMTGEWSYYSHCSECNYQEFFANEDVEKRHKYCLNCGARTGKEANHGN